MEFNKDAQEITIVCKYSNSNARSMTDVSNLKFLFLLGQQSDPYMDFKNELYALSGSDT